MERNALPEPEQAEQNDEKLGENQDKKTRGMLSEKVVAMSAKVEQAAEPEDRIDLCIELKQGFVRCAFLPCDDATKDIAERSIAAESHDDCRRKIGKGKHQQQHRYQKPGIMQQPGNGTEELFHGVLSS